MWANSVWKKVAVTVYLKYIIKEARKVLCNGMTHSVTANSRFIIEMIKKGAGIEGIPS